MYHNICMRLWQWNVEVTSSQESARLGKNEICTQILFLNFIDVDDVGVTGLPASIHAYMFVCIA